MRTSEFFLLPHARWTANNDGALLLDTRSGAIFSVNTIGGLMLKHIAEGHSQDHIVQSLSVQYEVGPDQVAADMAEFFTSLEQKRLVGRRP